MNAFNLRFYYFSAFNVTVFTTFCFEKRNNKKQTGNQYKRQTKRIAPERGFLQVMWALNKEAEKQISRLPPRSVSNGSNDEGGSWLLLTAVVTSSKAVTRHLLVAIWAIGRGTGKERRLKALSAGLEPRDSGDCVFMQGVKMGLQEEHLPASGIYMFFKASCSVSWNKWEQIQPWHLGISAFPWGLGGLFLGYWQ